MATVRAGSRPPRCTCGSARVQPKTLATHPLTRRRCSVITEPRCPSPLQEEEIDGGEEGEGEVGEGEGPTGQREVVTSGDVSSGAGEGVAVPKNDRITTPYITKFERARVLGTRALQISMNAPVMVELEGETDPLQALSQSVSQSVTTTLLAGSLVLAFQPPAPAQPKP